MFKALKLLMSIVTVVLIFGNFFVYSAPAHQPLVKENERVLFSFPVINSRKIVTIGLSTNQPEYIVYRFGTRDKIELEFPKDKIDSWGQFLFSYYFRGGGRVNEGLDLNYLIFTNEDYTYTVFQEYDAVDQTGNIGVRIRNNKTAIEYEMNGDASSCVGSLFNLRNDRRIDKGSAY
jgi:hypothetical protein